MNPEKIAGSPFAIGALGAVITAIKFTPGASLPERIVNVVSGSAFAGFVTPALVEWLHMSSPAYSSGAAFLMGLVGMSLAAAMLAQGWAAFQHLQAKKAAVAAATTIAAA